MDKFSLTDLAREHLVLAQDASSGRSASTVYGGRDHALRQTLIVLVAGQKLDEHENPGEATIYVLHGSVRLSAGQTTSEAVAGELLVVPDSVHAVEALESSAVLLTVAKLGYPAER